MKIRQSEYHPINISCDLMWISQHPIVRLVYFQVLPLLQVCVQVNWERNPRNAGKLGGTRKSEAIRTAVVALEDDSMITMTTKLADVDFLAKEVKYHHSCRRTYLRRAERLAEGSKRSETSKLYEDAYGTLKMYITSTLVDNKRAELLTCIAEHSIKESALHLGSLILGQMAVQSEPPIHSLLLHQP